MSGETYDDIVGSKATLPVPDVSLRLFRDRCPQAAGMDDAEVMDLIEHVASPLLVAELRRWLSLAGGYGGKQMRDRIEELEREVQDG